jgi:hypothetical protein
MIVDSAPAQHSRERKILLLESIDRGHRKAPKKRLEMLLYILFSPAMSKNRAR